MQTSGTCCGGATDPGELHRPAIHAWTGPCPAIDPGRILRLHGYTDPARIRPIIKRTSETVALKARELVQAQGCWRRVAIESLQGGVLQLAGDVTFTCPAFDRLLEGAQEVVTFVLTLGPAFDQAIIDLIDKQFEPLEALFLETAGRLAIEKLTRLLAADVDRLLEPESLVLGTRLGPGYTYRVSSAAGSERVMWALEQQKELFALFQSAPLPVELMSSSVMLPKMSRSGMIGVHRA